jgi:monofunctional glycosyltransferase
MKALWRFAGMLLLAAVGLELFFVAWIAALASLDPPSTTFQRSEAWRLATTKPPLRWSRHWVPYERISDHLKRAVIASEDDSFATHDGVDWEALEKAWQRNEQAQARVAQQQARIAARRHAGTTPLVKPPKIVGGSTITQQLAKNLLLSGERTLLRKGQEIVLTFELERLLTKDRILELYLNDVEWGEGVYGAEAAARHYYRKSAAQLTSYEAARLAVMLPRPRYFEKVPNSGYLAHRAAIIVGRMQAAELP